MNKRKAATISQKNRELNEQTRPISSNINDVASKLLKNEKLHLVDINELGQRISEKQGYDLNQLIVCEVAKLAGRLASRSCSRESPTFIICHQENTYAILCIIKLQERLVCLYTDFLNTQIPKSISKMLEQYFGESIEFKINGNVEHTANIMDDAILVLNVLTTMMINMKSDKKLDFIEGFDKPGKSYFRRFKDGIVGLKNELFSLVKESYYNTIASDIEQLSVDTEFKEAINNFIDSIPSAEVVSNFQIYQNLLKEFVDIGPSGDETVDKDDFSSKKKQLDEAKEKAFSSVKELNINTFSNEQDVELDIVKKFPKQMEKFTRIFEPLSTSKFDKKLDETLKNYSDKLNLDYDNLRRFYKAKDEKKYVDNNTSGIESNVMNNLSKYDTQKFYINQMVTNIFLFFSAIFMYFLKLFGWPLTLTLWKIKKLKNSNDEKPIEQLLTEIRVKNQEIRKHLRENYAKVKCIFESSCKSMTTLEINRWAVCKKGQLVNSEICEALAIMDRANELLTAGHRLRDTQILSVLTFLQQTDKGQLSQIQTGEGKTTIVSILAAIKALQGETVDVVTSNPILAAEGIKDKINFYNLLGLSATTNNLDENYKGGERECYKTDIVYGSISNFQFDYLKDSFLGMRTRAGRLFDRIILDEVDSMIIDNASHIAKLAGPFPGMESLKYVYIKIWQELYKAEQSLIQDLYRELKTKAQELEKLPENEAKLLYENIKTELENSNIIPKIKDHIVASNPTNICLIPSHIQEYAAKSLEKWIDSAIDAKYKYHVDEQYVIMNKNGEATIQPVDYANTGITLKNTVWQYGLHQFLQLKHNLHLTCESLTSCFISNISYINKYNNKIFGLTGTLGSKAEQELLSSIYNVEFAKIPTYKEKRFIEVDGEVVPDERFEKKVVYDAATEVENGRSVLIICETIKDAKAIQDILKRKHLNIVVKFYLNEDNAPVTEDVINPGEVVIATNIAGRGTDFKTSPELELNGGLHVCVAFLPCNKRVEDQAFGRTARQGNNGSAKLLVRRSETDKISTSIDSFFQIKHARDQLETKRITHIKELKIEELKFQDRMFELFSALYRKLKRRDQTAGEYQYVLDDLKEFWAFWLAKKDFTGFELRNKNPVVEFKKFENDASSTIHGEIKFNPYYSIQQAEHFILNDELEKAEQALHHAINISKNPEILHSVYFKLFEIAVEKGRALLGRFKKAVGDLFTIDEIKPDREYKKSAKKYLELAKIALKKELNYIKTLFDAEEFTSIIQSNENTNVLDTKENLFIKHIVSKLQALNLNMTHADSLIQQIDDLTDGISVSSRITDYFANFKPQNENEQKIKETISNCEFSELAAVGTNITYALREVHDVCPEIVTATRIQIYGGLEMLRLGCTFPPALPFTAAIGSTMISEGLCDIAMELIIPDTDGKFNKEAYIKGKVISYGLSLLTLGINAALKCSKILNAAKKACLWISKTLRKCPYLRKTCEKIANQFVRLGNLFEKLETIAKFNNMTQGQKLIYLNGLEKSNSATKIEYLGQYYSMVLQELKELSKLPDLTNFDKCLSTLGQVAVTTAKNVTKATVTNVIMSIVVTPAVSTLMLKLKPAIKKHVEESVQEHIDKEKLKYSSYQDIQKAFKEIEDSIDIKTIINIFKDVILTKAKYCRDWRLQLGAFFIDQCISWTEVAFYVRNLCENINCRLKCTDKSINNNNTDEMIEQLIEQISEKMYSQVVNTTIKTGQDMYTVGLSAYDNYERHKREEATCLAKNKDFKEGGLAGQEQAYALSDEIKRPIHICEENGNVIIIGGHYSGDAIKITYIRPGEANINGHYVPCREDNSWSLSSGKNNCLFDAVGSQIGKDANTLRQGVLAPIKSDPTRYMATYVTGDILLPGGRLNQRAKLDRFKKQKTKGTRKYYKQQTNKVKLRKLKNGKRLSTSRDVAGLNTATDKGKAAYPVNRKATGYPRCHVKGDDLKRVTSSKVKLIKLKNGKCLSTSQHAAGLNTATYAGRAAHPLNRKVDAKKVLNSSQGKASQVQLDNFEKHKGKCPQITYKYEEPAIGYSRYHAKGGDLKLVTSNKVKLTELKNDKCLLTSQHAAGLNTATYARKAAYPLNSKVDDAKKVLNNSQGKASQAIGGDLKRVIRNKVKLAAIKNSKYLSTSQHVLGLNTATYAARVAASVKTRRPLTPTVSLSMLEFEDAVKKHVKDSVKIHINKEKLNSCTFQEIENIIKELRGFIDDSKIIYIFKNVILPMSNNLRHHLGALFYDKYVSWNEFHCFVRDLCANINDKLTCAVKSENKTNEEERKQEMVSDQLHEVIYRIFLQNNAKRVKVKRADYSDSKSKYETKDDSEDGSESESEEESEDGITSGIDHLVDRLRRYIQFGGIIQRAANILHLPRWSVVKPGRSSYQDRHGTREHPAAHVVRMGRVLEVRVPNISTGSMDQNFVNLYLEITDFLGHTQLVDRRFNDWPNIGGDIDILQSNGRILNALHTINFSAERPSEQDIVRLLFIKLSFINIYLDQILHHNWNDLSEQDIEKIETIRQDLSDVLEHPNPSNNDNIEQDLRRLEIIREEIEVVLRRTSLESLSDNNITSDIMEAVRIIRNMDVNELFEYGRRGFEGNEKK